MTAGLHNHTAPLAAQLKVTPFQGSPPHHEPLGKTMTPSVSSALALNLEFSLDAKSIPEVPHHRDVLFNFTPPGGSGRHMQGAQSYFSREPQRALIRGTLERASVGQLGSSLGVRQQVLAVHCGPYYTGKDPVWPAMGVSRWV